MKSDSRGKAIAFQTIGKLLGEAFGMLVLFGLTINFEIDQSYSFSAVVLFILFTFVMCMIREPVIKNKSKEITN